MKSLSRPSHVVVLLAVMLAPSDGPTAPEVLAQIPAAPAPRMRGALEPDERLPITPARRYRAEWAVVIGIDAYPGGDGLRPLLYAANDASAVRRLLIEDFGYRPERVLFLRDGGATRSAISALFEEKLPRLGIEPDDALLLFFAGHGIPDRAGGGGYLAAVDSEVKRPAETCLAVDWVRDRLAALPCRHKLVLLDCCYSGSLFRAPLAAAVPGKPKAPGADARRHVGQDSLDYYLGEEAFLGMSAGRADEPVADGLGPARHSVFTATLLAVMREQANSSRADHSFVFGDLAPQVVSRVSTAVGSAQVPMAGRIVPGEGDFVFRPIVLRQTPRELSQSRLAREVADRGRALCERGEIRRGLAWLARSLELTPPGAADLRRAVRTQLACWARYIPTPAQLFDNTGRPAAARLSPDGRTVLTAGKGRSALLWDAKTGAQRGGVILDAAGKGVDCWNTP